MKRYPVTCGIKRCPPTPFDINQLHQPWALSQQQPEFSEVPNCVSGFSRELAVPPSKLVLLFNAAFCRLDQSLSY
jgi:hypothetical protein